MIKKYTRIFIFLALVVFIICLVTLFYFISPEEIVNKIGIRNGYILAFLVSFFGGFSAGGSVSFISLLVTLTIGGMNPLYLGLVAGVSLALGDILMFYIGSKGRRLVKGKLDEKINKFTYAFEKRNWLKKLVPFLAYFYIGLTPLPNDVLILFLAAIKYPSKKMNQIIILGDITFALTTTLLTAKGIRLFNYLLHTF